MFPLTPELAFGIASTRGTEAVPIVILAESLPLSPPNTPAATVTLSSVTVLFLLWLIVLTPPMTLPPTVLLALIVTLLNVAFPPCVESK